MKLAPIIVLLGACAWREGIRDVPNPSFRTYRDGDDVRVHLTRVLDAATFEPVRSARMFVDEEVVHPLPRFPEPVRVARADRDGWIRLRVDPGDGNWFYVDAPGYGPQAWLRGPPDTVYLVRGRNVAVEVQDPLGRPVPHATVAYYLGCGHTPDLRRVRTDAQGRGVLPCIDPTSGILWPEGEGVEARDWWGRLWEPWARPCVLVGPPGVVVEGTVLDEAGRPLGGVRVGDIAWNHGPWVETDRRGRFRLVGVEPFDWVGVDRPDREWKPTVGFHAPPPGTPVTFRYPGPASTVPVTVRLAAAEGPPLEDDILVHAVRAADGFTDAKTAAMGGKATLSLPPGRYEVVADGRLGPYGSTRATVDVAGPAQVTLTLPRNPWRRVTPVDLAEDDEVWLVSASFERDVTADARAGRVRVPPDVETALQVRRWGRAPVRIVAWPGAGEAPRLEPPRPATVRLRVVDPDGRPVDATVACEGDEEGVRGQGAFTVYSTGMGTDEITITPDSPRLGPRTVNVTFPLDGTGGAVVDLGEVRLRRRGEPPLRVLLPDGSPAAYAEVERAGDERDRSFTLDESGGGDGAGWGEPYTGETVEIRTEAFVPFRTRLEGPGPWTIRMERGGSVRLTVTDAQGSPVQDFTVFVDGDELSGSAGRFEVAGLRPGRHRLLIAGKGERAREWTFVLDDGARKEATVVLPGG